MYYGIAWSCNRVHPQITHVATDKSYFDKIIKKFTDEKEIISCENIVDDLDEETQMLLSEYGIANLYDLCKSLDLYEINKNDILKIYPLDDFCGGKVCKNYFCVVQIDKPNHRIKEILGSIDIF